MDSPEKTADLSELAKLITGNSVGPEEDRTAILAFLERTGFVPSFAKRLLERTSIRRRGISCVLSLSSWFWISRTC